LKSLEPTNLAEPVLTLVIHGKIPSFKNNKRVGPDRTPRTDKATRQRMREIEAALLSQLNSAWETASKTRTELSVLSWIASVAPASDSLIHIREIRLTADLMMRGEEVTIIEIF
jgi:hypothetical protein